MRFGNVLFTKWLRATWWSVIETVSRVCSMPDFHIELAAPDFIQCFQSLLNQVPLNQG